MFAIFLGCILAEIFVFQRPGDTLAIKFTLDPENINTGFFNPEVGHNMKFKVKIASKDDRKLLYLNDSLPEGKETHFSFNNTDSQDIVLHILSMAADEKIATSPSEFQMKFESTADTFNAKVSKEVQYKPAINALNHLLAKLNNITTTTKEVYNKSGDLRNEQRKMLSFVLGFSIVSLFAFAALNFFKLYLMKSYLNEKKYL